MSERQNPVTSDVLTTFDEVRDRLLARLEGMTDAEYLWEPVPHCLTVRVAADGVSRAESLATHAIDETAHHGAEIALLRDLGAHGPG